jgi:multicomponent K+:H+ antiporter subunit D
MVAATVALVAASVLLSLAAAPVTRYTDATARQLTDRAAYARAVLPELGGERAVTVRPYTGERPISPTPAATPPAAPPAAGASR